MHVPGVFAKEQTRDLGPGSDDRLKVTVMVVNEERSVDSAKDLLVKSMPEYWFVKHVPQASSCRFRH